MRRMKRVFLTGLFIIAPFSLSFILLAWFVALIDNTLAPLVVGFLGRPVPGLGLLLAFALILVAGVLATNLAGQHLLEWTEEMLLKIPVFNWVYRTIKQLSEVFSPSSKAAFKSVVLVEYPRPSVYSIGFVTNHLQLERDGHRKDFSCVYVPTNHMYIGDYILVPSDHLIATKLSQQEGIQAAISAGASLPELIKAVEK